MASVWDDLRAFWYLEEEAAAVRVDATGRGNDIPAVNSPGRAAGQVNYGVVLERSPLRRLAGGAGDDLLPAPGRPLWVGGWVKMTTLEPPVQIVYAVGPEIGANPRALWVNYNPGQQAFQFAGYAADAGSVYQLQSSVVPEVDTWYRIDAWHDPLAQTVNISVNGTVDTLAWTAGVYADPAQWVSLGGTADGLTFPAQAVVDAWGVWHRVPTAQDLADLQTPQEWAPPVVPSSSGTRWERFMVHLADLWQPATPLPAGGDPGATTWTPGAAGVKCHFRKKAAVDVPQIVGLLETEDLITIDEVRLPEGTTVESSWIILNRSLNPDGTEAAGFGDAYVVRGGPKRRVSAPTRPAGRVICFLSKIPLLPPGVG